MLGERTTIVRSDRRRHRLRCPLPVRVLPSACTTHWRSALGCSWSPCSSRRGIVPVVARILKEQLCDPAPGDPPPASPALGTCNDLQGPLRRAVRRCPVAVRLRRAKEFRRQRSHRRRHLRRFRLPPCARTHRPQPDRSKTTLLNVITGYVRPWPPRRVRLGNVDITGLRPRTPRPLAACSGPSRWRRSSPTSRSRTTCALRSWGLGTGVSSVDCSGPQVPRGADGYRMRHWIACSPLFSVLAGLRRETAAAHLPLANRRILEVARVAVTSPVRSLSSTSRRRVLAGAELQRARPGPAFPGGGWNDDHAGGTQSWIRPRRGRPTDRG